jgi:hypothetical protein
MSANTLLNLPTNATIQTGSAVTVSTSVNTNITFGTPFPSGSLPLVFVQNAQGTDWPQIIFTVQNLSNTGFTVIQNNLADPGTNEVVGISWLAVWVPITPPPA